MDTVQTEPDTDAHLLQHFVASQSEDAFHAIVARHANKVYSCCLRVLNDVHAAEDATQAVFLLLARKAAKLPPDTVLAGWLYRTASWTALETRRTLAIRGRHEHAAAAQTARNPKSGPDDSATENLRVQLSELLATLPPVQRDAIVLHFLDGRTEVEIAAELGCPASTVATRIARGLAKLRDGLQRRGYTLAAPFIPSLLSQLAKTAAPESLLSAIRLTGPGHTSASLRAVEFAAHSTRAASRVTLKTAVTVTLGAIAFLGTAGYVAHRVATPAPPSALTSAAYSPEIRDPKILWDVTLEGNTPSHLIANDLVLLYIQGQGQDTAKQWIEARQISDGAKVWTSSAGGTLCAVTSDIVICSSGADIFALKLSTGIERWRWHGNDTRRRSPVVYDNGEVFTVAAKSDDRECSICCLEATTGRTLWEAPAAVGPVSSAPSVDGDHVYVAGDNGVACVSRAEQRVLWSQTVAAKIAPSACGGRVIVPGREITCLSAANGAWAWTVPGHLDNSSLTATPDALYTGLQHNASAEAPAANVYAAIQPLSGKILWERTFAGEVHAGAAVTNQSVYVTCWDDALYALNRSTGEQLWRLPLTLNRWSPTPLMAADRMLVCFQNKIYCIGNK